MKAQKNHSSIILIVSFLMGTMTATLTSVDTLWARKMRIESKIHTMNWSVHETGPQGTSIEAEIRAEGQITSDPNGSSSALATGDVCVRNTGALPTENLAIKVFVQTKSEKEKFTDLFNFDIGTEAKPIIDSMEYFCFPFGIEFLPSVDLQRPVRIVANVTITNHSGWLPGNNNCPGPDVCPFGPTVATELVLKGDCEPDPLFTPTPTIEASPTPVEDPIPDTGVIETPPTVEATLIPETPTDTPTATPSAEIPEVTQTVTDEPPVTEMIAPTEVPVIEEVIDPTDEPTPEPIPAPIESQPE